MPTTTSPRRGPPRRGGPRPSHRQRGSARPSSFVCVALCGRPGRGHSRRPDGAVLSGSVIPPVVSPLLTGQRGHGLASGLGRPWRASAHPLAARPPAWTMKAPLGRAVGEIPRSSTHRRRDLSTLPPRPPLQGCYCWMRSAFSHTPIRLGRREGHITQRADRLTPVVEAWARPRARLAAHGSEKPDHADSRTGRHCLAPEPGHRPRRVDGRLESLVEASAERRAARRGRTSERCRYRRRGEGWMTSALARRRSAW